MLKIDLVNREGTIGSSKSSHLYMSTLIFKYIILYQTLKV
jgi:hypothetical protein